MRITVIISTYNNPMWLEKTLWGYQQQTRHADEFIIADDGSDYRTRALIARYSSVLPLKHVWQPNRGFRKTRILNKALLVATGDYLIFTDQDCIPRADFVATHERYAEKGYFLSGGYFRLPMSISLVLTRQEIDSGEAFKLAYLRKKGLRLSFRCAKLFQSPRFARLMNRITPTRATWNGMNASGWRSDILRAKGFDTRMRYGGEDRELGERLRNGGVRSKQIRYSAIALHLDHNRPYVNTEDLRHNKMIRLATRRERLSVTAYGL
jgi:glycosyltransferase involved in cell wall biosynthesis